MQNRNDQNVSERPFKKPKITELAITLDSVLAAFKKTREVSIVNLVEDYLNSEKKLDDYFYLRVACRSANENRTLIDWLEHHPRLGSANIEQLTAKEICIVAEISYSPNTLNKGKMNFETYKQYLECAGRLGSETAKVRLGEMLIDWGDESEGDWEKGCCYFDAAIKKGSGDASVYKGILYKSYKKR